MKEVFKCRTCGVCCRGEGGIYIEEGRAADTARLLGIPEAEFIRTYTRPRYGMLELKTDEEGWCLFHDRERCICRIHPVKPDMCRDWPFFWGPLNDPAAFEDAKDACPGLVREATWKEFVEYHRQNIGVTPPKSYFKPD